MYFLLTLFFASLFSIIFMVGRKLALVRNGETLINEEIMFNASFLKKWRRYAIQNIKKYGRVALIEALRFYIRSNNFLKNKYQDIKFKTRNIVNKYSRNTVGEKTEASKFLKMISEYKYKIREIKHRIHEEENGL